MHPGPGTRSLEGRSLRAVVCGGEKVAEGWEIAGAKDYLINALVAPDGFRLGRDFFAPVGDGGVFGGGAIPDAAFRFDDPVNFAGFAFLNGNPVGIIKADRAARF